MICHLYNMSESWAEEHLLQKALQSLYGWARLHSCLLQGICNCADHHGMKAHRPERSECHHIPTQADVIQLLYGRYVVSFAFCIRPTLYSLGLAERVCKEKDITSSHQNNKSKVLQSIRSGLPFSGAFFTKPSPCT